MADDTMVERVAKAIYAAEHGTEYQDGTPVRPSPDEWDVLLTCARAAIAAMREPTPEMIAKRDDDSDPVHWDYKCHVCGGAEHAWKTMIDAALGEK